MFYWPIMKKNLRKLFRYHYFIAFVVIILVYYILEVFVYTSAAYSFKKIECENDRICTKILLVADPQLIGLRNELFHPITPFTIFDIDRYLYKTYREAFTFVQPDVVVFLGDLFDEGSTSTDKEYKTYIRRFHSIYGKPTKNIQHIWLPGDNDIGGEDMDFITEHKTQRFDDTFNQSDVIQIKSTTFYKINRLTNKPVTARPKENLRLNNKNVALSHIPLLLRYQNLYVQQMIENLRPHVVFSAHEHVATIIDKDAILGTKRKIYLAPDKNDVHEFALCDEKIYEIMVPTASYRMGTKYIGHGYAVIENDRLNFTILWSPQRFPQLIFYGISLMLIVLYALFKFCKLSIKYLRLERYRESSSYPV